MSNGRRRYRTTQVDVHRRRDRRHGAAGSSRGRVMDGTAALIAMQQRWNGQLEMLCLGRPSRFASKAKLRHEPKRNPHAVTRVPRRRFGVTVLLRGTAGARHHQHLRHPGQVRGSEVGHCACRSPRRKSTNCFQRLQHNSSLPEMSWRSAHARGSRKSSPEKSRLFESRPRPCGCSISSRGTTSERRRRCSMPARVRRAQTAALRGVGREPLREANDAWRAAVSSVLERQSQF